MLTRPPAGADSPARARALWLQMCARRVAKAFDLEVTVTGPLPERGLLVANHLSYLDIVMLAALMPVVFVSKAEVANWPVFGWFAKRSGTLFVRREKRGDVGILKDLMAEKLAGGSLLILFPEGTSSDGREVLPFKPSLLEPAVNSPHPLAVAHLEYWLEGGGDVGREVCYWGDMTLAPHLLNLLSLRRVRATARFLPIEGRAPDRKELARQLHAEVVRLKKSQV